MIVFSQFYCHVLTESGRTSTDIHSHIKYGSTHTAHQLGLRKRGPLEMQPSHHTIIRTTLVILHELYKTDFLVKLSLRIGLEEIASKVLEYARFYDYDSIYRSLNNFHHSKFSFPVVSISLITFNKY